MPKIKLTKANAESIPLTMKGQTIYWDDELPGFGLCVGKTVKAFVVQSDVRGKTVRYTIGRMPLWTPQAARVEAKEILLSMQRDSVNPNQRKNEMKIAGATLKDVHNDYIANSKGRLADATKRNYEDFMKNHFNDWLTKPIREITQTMVVKRHAEITKKSGKTAANASFQYVRALYNYAALEDDRLLNPVRALSRRKLWHPKRRRRRTIKDHQLPVWYSAVMNLHNEAMKDALRLILFTGLRKMEALSLRWENVDLDGKSFIIYQTKNREPLELPLSDYTYSILQRRKSTAGSSPWVFPGGGKKGHATEPKKVVRLVIEESGVDFTVHDLRRTFITIAERLDISTYAIKSLVNHKTGNDVTTGYIVIDVERLRDPMQRITDELLQLIT